LRCFADLLSCLVLSEVSVSFQKSRLMITTDMGAMDMAATATTAMAVTMSMGTVMIRMGTMLTAMMLMVTQLTPTSKMAF
jgi:hypothetical protein